MDSERTFGPRPSTVPDDVTKSEKVEIEDTNGYAKDTADDEKTLAAENDADDLDYPQPWRWEKWFLGGYSPSRMFKFKKSSTMYKAINLFAGLPNRTNLLHTYSIADRVSQASPSCSTATTRAS
jgi:hypothetical protein